MRVVYDISVLGIGYHFNARAGIFRVAEQLIDGLMDLQGYDLSFCASLSSESLVYSIDYLLTRPELKDILLLNGNVENFIYANLKSIYHNDSTSNHKINLTKILKKLLFYHIKLKGTNHESFSLKEMHGNDIFHSPFYQLPESLRAIKGLHRFITIHDLIPVIYPNFFNGFESQLEIFNSILDCLTPDDWIFCVSQSTKDDLLNRIKHIDSSKVIVTHLAASDLFYPCKDFERIASTRKKYSIPDRPYILSLSTLEPRKNIAHVIRCFSQLVQEEKIDDLILVLAGSKGWDYERFFEEMSFFASLKDRVFLTDYIQDEDLAALYSGALAFVYLSYYEGFGLPPLEAMRCGVPVIVSNTSSLPEVVGDAGIQLDPDDCDGLCQSLSKIYSDPFFRETMAKKSIEQASKFSWNLFMKNTVEGYSRALNS